MVLPTTKVAASAMRSCRSRGERVDRVTIDSDLDDLAAEAGQQRGGRVERDDPTLGHDRDAVAQLLGLVEVVRGQQDRHLPSAETGDVVQELEADARVQADRRLVEEQDLRVRQQRTRDLEASALAAAVGVDRAVDELAEPERRAELADASVGVLVIETPQAGVHGEVPPAGQRAVDGRLLEDDRADAAGLARVTP